MFYLSHITVNSFLQVYFGIFSFLVVSNDLVVFKVVISYFTIHMTLLCLYLFVNKMLN